MAIVDPNGTARIASGGPAGLPGQSAYQAWLAQGNVGSLADYLESLKGQDGRNGRDGRDGAGTILTRTANVGIQPWTAVVPDGVSGCIPADTSNQSHRGQVLGVTANGGGQGTLITIVSLADLDGPGTPFTPDTTLFPGANGVLTAVPPTSGWRQVVATATAPNHIVVALGEARVIDNDGTAIIAPDGAFVAPTDFSRELIQTAPDQSAFRDGIGIGPTGTLPIAVVAVSDAVNHASGSRARFGGQVDQRAVVDPVTNEGRLEICRVADTPSKFATLYIQEDLRNSAPGVKGGTSSVVKMVSDIGAININQWPFISTINLWGSGQGEHVAVTGQVLKQASAGSVGSAVWAGVFEFRDYTTNPQRTSVAIEAGLHTTGPDPNGVRIAVDISLGEANTPGSVADCASKAGISVANTSGVEYHRTDTGVSVTALYKTAAYYSYSRETVAATIGASKRHFQGGTVVDSNAVAVSLQERRFLSTSGASGTASELIREVDGSEQNAMRLYNDRTEFSRPVISELMSFVKATLPNPGLWARKTAYLSDGDLGKRLIISAGTAWFYADGTSVF